MLSPTVIVTLQFLLGLTVFVTVARQYVIGPLQRADAFAALAPVLLIHGFRLLGLTFLAPGQVAAGQDLDALEIVAYGDFSAALVGTVAALAAYRRSALTVPLAWLLTVVGLADFAVVGVTVSGAGTLDQGIGAMWLTFGLVAPLLVLSHGYVLYVLLRRRDELTASVRTSVARAGGEPAQGRTVTP